MNVYYWIFDHFLPTLGFLLAVVLFNHILRERRPPSSTIAWLLAIVFFPYAGVPLYIIFGGRKMRRMSAEKVMAPGERHAIHGHNAGDGHVEAADDSALFPLSHGNRVQLLTTGEAAFHELMETIGNARHSIYITTFILGSDETGRAIIDLLTRKAREGIEVRLLLDALGSHAVRRGFLDGFHAAGGQSAFFMPMLHIPFRGRANLRNHRKMVIVDHAMAITGGMNFAHEYMGEKRDEHRWHDLSISLEGPVVDDLLTVFRSDWTFTTGRDIGPAPDEPVPVKGDGGENLQLVPSGPDIANDRLYDAILTSFFTARKRIWIVTPYFIPDEMLLNALRIAAKKVDVRIIIPEISNHRLADIVRRDYLRQIQNEGARIYMFRPGMLHAKAIIFDDSLGVVGSMNVDMRSFFLNYEVAVFIHSERTVSQLELWAESLMAESEAGARASSFPLDYVEGIARLLSPLL